MCDGMEGNGANAMALQPTSAGCEKECTWETVSRGRSMI